MPTSHSPFSRVPVLVEARVRLGISQDEQAMLSLRRRVSDLVAAQRTLRDGELPLHPELLTSLVSVRVCGITDAAHADIEAEKDMEQTGSDKEEDTDSRATSIAFWKADTNIVMYECLDPVNVQEKPSIPFASVTTLPSATLEGLWDALHYSTGIKGKLLSYLSAGAHFRKNGVSPQVICWHGIALLYGKPGTGKTTLCRALAHKLAIRYTDAGMCYLVEVRADAVFSKFFSESARNVGSLFQAVSSLAAGKGHVFMLLDEVESLAGSRTSSEVDGQPADALRAVNALLTALDSVRGVENCTVLATSNLVTKIDPAFLDRVDIHQLVPQPGFVARRDIIRECVNELCRAGIVVPDSEGQKEKGRKKNLKVIGDGSKNEAALTEDLVKEAARAAKGLSGRALRKLPLLAHAAHVRGTSKKVPTACFLRALKAAAITARKNRA